MKWLIALTLASAPLVGSAAKAQPIAACPDNFESRSPAAERLTCTCDANATRLNNIWGTDVYTADSSICVAAVHAGAIPPRGGQVTAIAQAGRDAYPGITRNGIDSYNFGAYPASFRFAEPPRVLATPAAAPVQQDIAAGLRDRGQVDLYIQFRLNSAELEPAAATALQELANLLNSNPGMRLGLIGHTDATGSPQHNLGLSKRRAESVRSWLMSQGISPARIQVDGRGPNGPVADNATEFGRAANRRVQALRQ